MFQLDAEIRLPCPRICGTFALALALCCAVSLAERTQAAEEPSGEKIYRQKCAACHGPQGQGVEGEHEDLLYGERPLAEVIKIIDETMPSEHVEQCTGEDARKVGQYIYESFYTARARAKNNPPRIDLARLTVEQYENCTADLIAGFLGRQNVSDARGLKSQYYNDRKFNGGEKKLERVDPRVDFDFQTKSPHEKLRDSEFSIRFSGSLIVEHTGDYEIGVRSENGFQLWVNDTEIPLVDGYVAAGPEPTLRSATIRLLAGRAYPLRLEWFKYKDKTASVELAWKPPHQSWQVIPERNLTPDRAKPTFVVTTPFPPDDSSLGYPRGTSVSQAWDDATTYAAVEVANFVVRHLPQLSGVRKDASDRRERLAQFCERFAERALRRPLTDEQRQIYVASQFNQTDAKEEEKVEAAVKRSILITLKSPHFLYVNLPREVSAAVDDYDQAAQLALALWDSLPDEALLQAATRNELHTREQIADHARRMAADPRAKAKLHGFLEHWLQLNETEHLAKDREKFTGFDDEFAADLRNSLELFLDEVLSSDGASFQQLLLADYWYANSRMAKFYGLEVPEDGQFHKVTLPDKSRVGVVTHPYMLASLSYHQSTSPIHRGVFASRKLLSRPLNPPPQAIEFMDAGFDPHLTMREKVTKLTSATACQSCHSIINPLGFSLENFDAVGRFQTKENDQPVNPASDYTTYDGKSIRLSSARDLAEYAASSQQAQQGFVERLFHHTAKQPAAAYGPQTLETLHRSFVDSQYNIRTLLIEIAIVTAMPAERPITP